MVLHRRDWIGLAPRKSRSFIKPVFYLSEARAAIDVGLGSDCFGYRSTSNWIGANKIVGVNGHQAQMTGLIGGQGAASLGELGESWGTLEAGAAPGEMAWLGKDWGTGQRCHPRQSSIHMSPALP